MTYNEESDSVTLALTQLLGYRKGLRTYIPDVFYIYYYSIYRRWLEATFEVNNLQEIYTAEMCLHRYPKIINFSTFFEDLYSGRLARSTL